MRSAAELLVSVGLVESDIERYRRAWEVDGLVVVETRTGGGNRPHYPNTKMRSSPFWIRTEDDEGDSTYAYDFFDPKREDARKARDREVRADFAEKVKAAVQEVAYGETMSETTAWETRVLAAIDALLREEETP